MNVNASEFGIQSELELVIASLKKTLDYYTDKLEKVLNEDGKEAYIRFLREAETAIQDYRDGLGALDRPAAREKISKGRRI